MAGISKNTIVRLAFDHLASRGAHVENIDTEDSVEARRGKLWYDIARREALVDFNWRFARKREALSVSPVAAPTVEWGFRYKMPADALAPRYIENLLGPVADAVPYKVEVVDDGTETILTDLENPTLVYTFDQQSESSFTPHFVICLSYLLAHYLAPPTTGKKDFKTMMAQAYYGKLRLAGASEGNQEQDRAPRDADAIRAREGGQYQVGGTGWEPYPDASN